MHKSRWGIIIILLIYILLAVSYSLVTPPFEAPDEIHHYAFIRDLVRDRALPVQHEDDPPSQRHQPPLYYLAGAAVTFWVTEPEGSPYSVARNNPYWGYAYGEVGRDNKNLYLHGTWDSFPYRGTALGIHLARLLSVLMGAASVYIAYRIGLELFPAQSRQTYGQIHGQTHRQTHRSAPTGIGLELFPAQSRQTYGQIHGQTHRQTHRSAPTGGTWVALGSAALMAFNPMFLFISGAVNNDNLIVLWVTLILWLLARTARAGITTQRSVWIGVLCGLALLTKLTALYILPVVAVVFLVTAWRRGQWKLFIQSGLIIAGLALLVAGWWFARNIALYGELTSIRLTLRTWHARPEGMDWGAALFELPNAETSFWARFGYGNVPVPNVLYQFFGLIARLGAVGCVGLAYHQAVRALSAPNTAARPHRMARAATLLLALLAWSGIAYSVATITGLNTTCRYALMGVLSVAALFLLARDLWRRSSPCHSERSEESPFAGVKRLLAPFRVTPPDWPPLGQLGVLALTTIAYFAAMFTYMLMSTTAANGRYMFPGLAAVSILVFIGLIYYAGLRWSPVISVGWTAALIVLSLLILALYLKPAYTTPPILPAGSAQDIPQNLRIDYGHQVELLGATVEPSRARPGDVVEVTLFWQALEAIEQDYGVTVQVFGREGKRIGQRDSFTGLGNYPTSEWQPGEVIVDTYRVTLDPKAAAPVEAEIEAGLYDPVSLDRLLAFDVSGQPLGRTLAGHFKLSPRKTQRYEWQQAADFSFGDQIALRGYDIAPQELKAGEMLSLTLYWQALTAVDRDYTVFIHLLDGAGQARAQQDAPPIQGDYPSSLWEENEIVQDIHDIPLPADLPPGTYRIALGLYSLETMQRLPAVDNQGVRLSDDRIILCERTVDRK